MGLGLAVVQRFISDGMQVVTCARQWHAVVPGAIQCRADVSNRDDIVDLVRGILRLEHRIDVLVCNAAIYGPVGSLEETDWFDWLKAIDINLIGTVSCCSAVLPIMRRQGHGKIITLSGGGVHPHQNTTAYNTSKGGVLRFTEALARDLEGTGIDVNAVAPGTLDTRMRLRAALPDDPDANMRKAVALIAWLISSASDGITGRLFSAVWDDWEHLGELGQDDYRMRRVVP